MSTSDASIAWTALPEPVGDAVTDLLLNRTLALVITDPRLDDDPIVHASPGFTALTGYGRDELLGRNCRLLQGPATDVAALDRLRTALKQGQSISVDLVNYRKNGEPFGNRLRVDPILIDGELRYFLGVLHELPLPGTVDAGGRDIVLRDLRHRMNGAMQLAMSLLRLRMVRTSDPAVVEALADALEQLDAVMLVQRQLDGIGRNATADAGPALAELAQSLVAGFDGKVAVDLACASLPLPPHRLEPLLMLANEALINALRHAFPDNRRGVIHVSLTPADGGFELLIEDDGVGAPPGSLERGTLGTMLMRSFARQLGGTLELANGSGVRLRLRCPPAAEPSNG
jgi:PAS domain S-box-containing protein